MVLVVCFCEQRKRLAITVKYRSVYALTLPYVWVTDWCVFLLFFFLNGIDGHFELKGISLNSYTIMRQSRVPQTAVNAGGSWVNEKLIIKSQKLNIGIERLMYRCELYIYSIYKIKIKIKTKTIKIVFFSPCMRLSDFSDLTDFREQ